MNQQIRKAQTKKEERINRQNQIQGSQNVQEQSQYQQQGDIALFSLQWEIENGNLNNLLMKIHGTYQTQNQATEAANKLVNTLEHKGIPIIFADTKVWTILPLNPRIQAEKNLTYDQRVKKILMKSLEYDLDTKDQESNRFLEKMRSNLEQNPVEFISDFQNNDMFIQYIDELLKQSGLQKEYKELVEKKKEKHIKENDEKNKRAIEKGKRNIQEARKKFQEQLSTVENHEELQFEKIQVQRFQEEQDNNQSTDVVKFDKGNDEQQNGQQKEQQEKQQEEQHEEQQEEQQEKQQEEQQKSIFLTTPQGQRKLQKLLDNPVDNVSEAVLGQKRKGLEELKQEVKDKHIYDDSNIKDEQFLQQQRQLFQEEVPQNNQDNSQQNPIQDLENIQKHEEQNPQEEKQQDFDLYDEEKIQQNIQNQLRQDLLRQIGTLSDSNIKLREQIDQMKDLQQLFTQQQQQTINNQRLTIEQLRNDLKVLAEFQQENESIQSELKDNLQLQQAIQKQILQNVELQGQQMKNRELNKQLKQLKQDEQEIQEIQKTLQENEQKKQQLYEELVRQLHDINQIISASLLDAQNLTDPSNIQSFCQLYELIFSQ